MSEGKPLDAIELKLGATATPARVMSAVQMLAEVARAAGADLESSDFTIVVRNFDMQAELRAWTLPAQEVLKRIDDLVLDPFGEPPSPDRKDASEEQWSARIAEQLAKWAEKVAHDVGATIRRKSTKRRPRHIDDKFVRIMKAVAEEPRAQTIRRTVQSVVESPVLQVGRTSEKSTTTKAVIVVDGRQVALPIASGHELDFARAMATRVTVRVAFEAPLVRKHTGQVDFDWRHGLALSVERFEALTGPQFLRASRQLSKETTDLLADVFGVGD